MTTATRTPGHKQRIEGVLHRSLPATLTIREATPGQADDGLMRLRLSVSSEIEYLRQSYWDDPWIEVLGHQEGEIDLVRLNGGAAVLANHDRRTATGNTPLAAIGAVERAWIEGDRLICDITISRREALADLRQDILDNLVRNVSIGYTINERVLIRAHGEGQPDEYRVTSWTPFEVSLVDIPADATVGLGRSQDTPDPQNPQSRYRVIDLSPAEGTTQGERSMPQTATPPAAAPEPATRTQDVQLKGEDYIAQERTRAKEIRALARSFDAADLGEKAIDDGTSLDAFRAHLLNGLKEKGQLRQAESPEIGLSERELKQFSLCRTLLAAADPANAHKIAPFELECSRAAREKRDQVRKERETAITIPFDVLARGIDLPAGVAAAVAPMLARSQSTRALVAGTASAGGNLVATELLGSSFIELLRNAMVLDRLGITWLRGLSGNVVIPSQDGAATCYWVDEAGAPTGSQQSIDQVPLTPKTIGAYTDYSRRLLLQSSLDVEAFVRADLAAIVGLGIQQAALVGGGTHEPVGLLNTSGIGSVAGGTDGAAPTYEHMVDLETAVSSANADVGNLGYLTNSKVRGKLRKTQEFASTNGKAVWTSGRERGIGEVLGYDAHVTNAMPSNLVKGGSGAVCSAIAFGNWADMIIGMWGGLDVMLDPYALATSGGRRVIALQDVDVAFRHVESFAVMKDAKTA